MFVTVSLLLAAACLLPAAGKLLGHPQMRHAAAHFGIPWHYYRLIGAAELTAERAVVPPLGIYVVPRIPAVRLPRIIRVRTRFAASFQSVA